MLHVGVDEAGYGPVVGPLVIGVAAFRLPDAPAPWTADLRGRLKGIVVRRPRSAQTAGRRLPVPVDDSKRIRSRFGLPGLARGVGAFAAAMDVAPPAHLLDLLRRFSERSPEDFGDRPWYGGLGEAAVPRYPWTGPLAEKFRGRGVEALDLRVFPVDAPEWNDSIDRLDNKASALGLASGAALLAVLDRHPDGDAEVVFDRHGGRLDYAAYLGHLFPFSRITPREAPHGEALYDVDLPARRLHVRFVTEGDARHLSVGWASMAAKLTRELFMERLNAWFAARLPALRRTAGYYRDGRRFVREVVPLLRQEGIDEQRLVRAR